METLQAKNQKSKTYTVSVRCHNCGYRGGFIGYLIEIPFGFLIQNYLRTQTCKKCGCYSLCSIEQ